MSKELTPLEAFKRFRNNIRSLEENTSLKYFFEKDALHFKEDLDIIETALKREDNIEITAIDIEQENQALCKENKKLKQILEIIKDMFEIWEDNGTYHIRPLFDIARITKEEYDLLKEVLL